MLGQMIQAFFLGVSVGVYALWNGFQVFLSLNNTKNMIIAAILGVPLAVVVIGLGAYKLIKFLIERLG